MVCTKEVTSERCILTQGGGSQDVPQQLCMGVVSNWKVLQPRGPVPDPEDLTEELSDCGRTGASKQQDRWVSKIGGSDGTTVGFIDIKSSQVLKAQIVQIATLCSLVRRLTHFKWICCLYLES